MSSTTTVFAGKYNDFYLLNAPYYTSCSAEKRTTDYSYIKFKCTTVHPSEQNVKDTYTRMRMRIANTGSTVISVNKDKSNEGYGKDYFVITENTGYYDATIKEGYLSTKSIVVQVGGNSPEYKAKANFSFDPQ